jgi:hypothetical protein
MKMYLNKMKRVNVNQILKTENYQDFEKIFEFHKYLKKQNLFTVDQQARFIHKVNQRIKEYFMEEMEQSLFQKAKFGEEGYLINLMLAHINNNLFDLSELTFSGRNPFADFIQDCNETQIYRSEKALFYMDKLIESGDDLLTNEMQEVFERCLPHRKRATLIDDY